MNTNDSKKIKKPNLFQIIFGVVVFILKKKKTPQFFPQIGNYKIVSTINKDLPFENFSIGIYSDGIQHVFIKTWSGNIKDFNYYSLLSEYFANTLLSDKLTVLDTGVSTPKIIEVIQNKNTISLVFEYIEATHLKDLSVEQQEGVILKIKDTLEQVTQNLSEIEQKNLGQRSPLFYFLSFPLILTMFIFLFPKKTLLALKTSLASLPSIYYLINQRLVITHRDITPQNVLITSEKIWLLDLEETVLAPAPVEAISIAMNPDFFDVKNNLVKSFLHQKNAFLQTYLVLHAMINTRNLPNRFKYFSLILSDLDLIWKKEILT